MFMKRAREHSKQFEVLTKYQSLHAQKLTFERILFQTLDHVVPNGHITRSQS